MTARALPRSARQLVELAWRSAPLREAQATNKLPNCSEASQCVEYQLADSSETRRLVDVRYSVMANVEANRHFAVGRVWASAYFSDRGRLFQSDRGRRNGVAGVALG